MRLNGKVAIVTGGGSGIGRATCLRFAEEGASVFLSDLNEAGGQETVRQIDASGGAARFTQADMSQESECERVVDECMRAFGKVNVLVNNAAAFVMKGVEATPDDWRRVMETNVYGYAYTIRFATEPMKQQGGGAVVNLASVSSVIAQPQLLTYNASKGAVLQLTRCAALDLAPDNIRVNCVCPGLIWSEQVQKLAAERGLTKAEAEAELGAMQIMKRAGEPREVAQAILFLASDESSFCTGSALFVDGGFTAQ
jgi:NAD(P)-dependent dehydrogenase (short-subunit alcohol dehydrogenase family)